MYNTPIGPWFILDNYIFYNVLVVDIYQQWCGPCTGMVSNLKKIRNDIGDDLLKYAAVSCMRNVEPIKRKKFPVC